MRRRDTGALVRDICNARDAYGVCLVDIPKTDITNIADTVCSMIM